METYEEFLAKKHQGSVLVVDDVPAICAMHRLMLARIFEVRAAGSGKEALAMCGQKLPDLVLLDVEMPELNGFDTCRKLREVTDIPIIFATAHDAPEEHLKAFEAGGTDICVKPMSAEILLRKVSMAIERHRERSLLLAERESLRSMAEQYLSSASASGSLLQFMRASLACKSHTALGQIFVDTARAMGVQCCIAIRHGGTETALSAEGQASPLEKSVLAQLSSMGREIRFKNRLGLNYERVSVVVSNMPEEDSPEAIRIRDSMTQLVETTEALAESLSQPSAAADCTSATPQSPIAAAEALRLRHRGLITQIGLALSQLQDNIDASFDRLATDKHHEEVINAALQGPVEQIQQVLRTEAANDQGFAELIAALGGEAQA